MRCAHAVSHTVRTHSRARGARTRSRVHMVARVVARAHGRARGRAQVKKNTRSFNIKDFFFVNQICHLPYPSLFALIALKIEIITRLKRFENN